MLLENLIDLACVPFADHGLQGMHDDVIPINMTIPTLIMQWDFNCSIGNQTMRQKQITMEFCAPFLIQYYGGFYKQIPESFLHVHFD